MNMQQKAPIPTLPIILRDRQERFCVLIVEGKSAREAYALAYKKKIPADTAISSPIDACASKLLKIAKVQLRISQIRAYEAAANRVSLQSLTEMLSAAYHNAIRDKQHSAAVQAGMGLAKLHGYLVDKHQVDAIVRRPSINPDSPDAMTEDAWLAEFGVGSALIEHDPDEGSGGEGSNEP